MSKRSIISTNSNRTLSLLKEREQDSIPFRIDFIKTLLDGKDLATMIDFENTETENFINPNKLNLDENDFNSSVGSHDTRASLNKRLHDFNKIINQIGGRLQYIKSGTTGHTFQGKIFDDNNEFNYAVKVVAYPKKERYGTIHDTRRPENAELMMIRLLSYFVVKKQTPHIVLPIATFNTSIKPFVSLVKENVIEEDNKKYMEFIERFNNDEYHDNVSILISEWANRGDFLDFLRKHYRRFKAIHWKVFFFQIISTLAVIQSKFPAFRHNDLKANNILVNKVERDLNIFSYKIQRKIYNVPNVGYQLKLWDFDFACIPGVVDNAKVASDWTKAINVVPKQNRYYDVHYFFNTLIKKGFFPQIIEDPKVPQETKDFIYRIVPKKYREGKYVHKRGRILTNEEYLIPDEIIKTDPYFEEFRIQASPNVHTSEKGIQNKNGSIRKEALSRDLKVKKKKSNDIDEIKLEDLLNSD
jgi:serine/threonine protein kinase